jgi:hypothetical protein
VLLKLLRQLHQFVFDVKQTYLMINWAVQLFLQNSFYYYRQYLQRCFLYLIVLTIKVGINDFNEPIAILIFFRVIREFSRQRVQAFQALQFDARLVDTAEVENVIEKSHLFELGVDDLPLESFHLLNVVFEEGERVRSSLLATTAETADQQLLHSSRNENMRTSAVKQEMGGKLFKVNVFIDDEWLESGKQKLRPLHLRLEARTNCRQRLKGYVHLVKACDHFLESSSEHSV